MKVKLNMDQIILNTIRDILDDLSGRLILIEKKVNSLQKENESVLENINYLIGRINDIKNI